MVLFVNNPRDNVLVKTMLLGDNVTYVRTDFSISQVGWDAKNVSVTPSEPSMPLAICELVNVLVEKELLGFGKSFWNRLVI